MFKDNYDLDVSCASDAALQAYLSGVECALRFDQPGISQLTEAVTEDEEFALAHATLARQLFIHGFAKKSAVHRKKAMALADKVGVRERRAIFAMERAARFSDDAIDLLRTHIEVYPQDVVVLSYLVGPFGMLAFSGTEDWHLQNIELLDRVQNRYRDNDWWHITTRGFFAAETGDLTKARADCERAWAIDGNGNCAHSLAHFYYEAGDTSDGRDFVEKWLHEQGTESDMRHHMIWHLFLTDIDNGVPAEELFGLFDRELDHEISDPMPLTTFSDNASFLWRMKLSGIDVSRNTCANLWDYADRHYPNTGFGFADIHRIMAAALHPDADKLNYCQNRLHADSESKGTDVAECLAVCASAFGAYRDEDYDRAADLLEAILEKGILFGGSNPQRRIIDDTYLSACLKAKQFDKVRRQLENRQRGKTKFDCNILEQIAANE